MRFAVAIGVVLSLGLSAGGARADGPRAVAQRSVDDCLADLSVPAREAAAVQCLGASWDEARSTADWDDAARGPRAFSVRVAPALRSLVGAAGRPVDVRRLALRLLVQLVDPATEPMLLSIIADARAPGAMRALAADGLARFADPAARSAILEALASIVPAPGAAPPVEAWALCAAVARAPNAAADARITLAVERLFRFAPQGAVQACLPLLRRMPSLADVARDVLDGRGFPTVVEGDDPRDEDLLVPAGRGAALLLLAELHTRDAMPRLEAALADTSLAAGPTRDGAVQGLAVLGGRRARRLLRGALVDPARRSPRVAHALLRLGDSSAARALRDVALDSSADVDTRLSAANAYTLLVPATPRVAAAWEGDLARSGPIGPPFEALDARLATFGARIGVAARCARRAACWAAALTDANGQVVARALWELARTAPREGLVGRALTETSIAIVAATPANEEHDRVAAALALLAREPSEMLLTHLPVLRRARAAWEGRTTPMGLPFDIPLALAHLDERVAPTATADARL